MGANGCGALCAAAIVFFRARNSLWNEVARMMNDYCLQMCACLCVCRMDCVVREFRARNCQRWNITGPDKSIMLICTTRLSRPTQCARETYIQTTYKHEQRTFCLRCCHCRWWLDTHQSNQPASHKDTAHENQLALLALFIPTHCGGDDDGAEIRRLLRDATQRLSMAIKHNQSRRRRWRRRRHCVRGSYQYYICVSVECWLVNLYAFIRCDMVMCLYVRINGMTI